MQSHAHVYEIAVRGKPQSVLSLLPPDHVFKNGLPGAAILGSMKQAPNAGGEITADNVVPNPGFVTFLQEFISRNTPADPAFQRAARKQGEGWVYVIDGRTPTPKGDVPLEDVVGGFRVQDGALVEGSYHPMNSYRVIGANGVMRLDGFLLPRLIDALQQLRVEDGAGEAAR